MDAGTSGTILLKGKPGENGIQDDPDKGPREGPATPSGGDFSPDEHIRRGQGSHCMTLACSAFRTTRQIHNQSGTKSMDQGISGVQVRNPVRPEISLGCRDLGYDCEYEITDTEAKIVLRKFIGHAEQSHNLPVLPADVLLKLRQTLKE